MTRILLTTLLLILAVAFVPRAARSASAASGAAANPSAALAKLCDEFWQGWLVANPTQATVLGDHRYDGKLEDISPAGVAREEARLKNVLARAQAIDEKPLSPAERVSRSALILE